MKVEIVDYKAPDAAETLARSLRDTGFAVLKNHPISAERIGLPSTIHGAASSPARKSLILPCSRRRMMAISPSGPRMPRILQSGPEGFFHVYRAAGCLPTSRRTRRIYADLDSLGRELLGWIQQQAPAEVAENLSMPLDQMMEERPVLLRILHYPPVEKSEPGAIRAAAHEDINLITSRGSDRPSGDGQVGELA